MQNFKEELSNEENPAIIRIGEYLAKRAETDASVAKSIEKENKSLAECYVYVRKQARKQAVNGCACVDEETVYGWAVHYYDEDDIKESEYDVKKEKEAKDKYSSISNPFKNDQKITTDTISNIPEPPKKKKRVTNRKKSTEPIEGQISLF